MDIILLFRYNETEPERKAVKNMEKKTLGAFIALLRREKGLTQKRLAELLNVSDKTVSHWECDETSPDISLLPLLAQTLGVTVDELLKGEKKPVQTALQHHYTSPKGENIIDKAEQLASKTVNRIKENANGDITERYKLFRLLSLVGTVISLVVLARVCFTTASGASFGTYVNFMFMPGIIALFGSLWTIAISLGFTIGARFFFTKELKPRDEADEKEKEYIYKANAFSFNNIFLVLCILPVPLIGIDILPILANIAIALVFLGILRIVLTVVLSKKGIIRTSRRKLFATKYISIFAVSVVLVAGGLIFLQEVWVPTPENIIFDNSAEFKAYMETPKAKPDNAYLIDGVEVTYFPTTMIPTTQPVSSFPVQDIPQKEDEDVIGESVMGLCGREWITFKWLNQEVYDCAYNDEEGTFHVITYQAKIDAKNQADFIDDTLPVIVVLFCIADAVTCFALYKKKAKELTNDY